MQLALRPYVTAGIALVGASVIAISPISPVTPDIHVPSISTSSVAVDLAAAVNPIGDPISAWVNTVANAVEGAVGIGGQVLGSGAPVLTQVLANQMGYANLIGTAVQNTINGLANWQSNNQWLLDYAYSQLKAGQVGDAISYLTYALVNGVSALFPMIDFLKIPGMIAQNFANVAKKIPDAVMGLGLSAIMAAQAPIHAFARQVQGLVDAVNAGDPLSAVNAVLNIPAAMTNAFLGSLLGPYTNPFSSGLIANLVVGIPKMIAQAIKPPASPVALSRLAGPAAEESAPAADPADTKALGAAKTPAVEAATTDHAPASTGVVSDLASGATDAVGSITNIARSTMGSARTLTLSLDPKPVATETPSAGETSANDDTAGGSDGSSSSNGSADNSAGAGADADSSDASTVKADKGSKKEARAAKRQAKQGAKPSKSTGGTHRAGNRSGG